MSAVHYSHWLQFKLNDRFNLDVAISFAAPHTNVPKIVTDGRIEVQIDIPPPFSFMPKPVLESAGNTALQGTLSILLVSGRGREFACMFAVLVVTHPPYI
jgi:hypothetical protein